MTGVSEKTISRITQEGKTASRTSKKIVTPGKITSRDAQKKADFGTWYAKIWCEIKLPTQKSSKNVLEKIKTGELSAYGASKYFRIPINTIKTKIKNKHMEKVGRPTALTKEEEIIVKEHVKALADSGILVGQDDVSLVIQRYLNSTNRKVKVFTNNRPGWEWSQLFLGRHQDLKLAFGHNISRGRAQVDEAKIKQFFDNLEVELQDVSPENIYNFDETGFHDDPKKKKMIFKRKCRNPEVIRNSTKSCYTTVFCGNAAGEMIPPYFIYKAKNIWSDWLIGAPPGSRMSVTKSGWIDLESFEDWFSTHFLPISLKKEGKKILCDNLSSQSWQVKCNGGAAVAYGERAGDACVTVHPTGALAEEPGVGERT
ncbi:unnamed protein product [Arctia plantaginis]|uniref:DDE-1 domain-containing protein n=1 Tax=Arctia plantaginis TaxID=874455 RepID=A0A8S1AAE3_ARCPL|nr:unnamed protein product [Arctia plantaginis]